MKKSDHRDHGEVEDYRALFEKNWRLSSFVWGGFTNNPTSGSRMFFGKKDCETSQGFPIKKTPHQRLLSYHELGSQRIFKCQRCEMKMKRDINGARNVLLKYMTEKTTFETPKDGPLP
jgi:hypothetical protein